MPRRRSASPIWTSRGPQAGPTRPSTSRSPSARSSTSTIGGSMRAACTRCQMRCTGGEESARHSTGTYGVEQGRIRRRQDCAGAVPWNSPVLPCRGLCRACQQVGRVPAIDLRPSPSGSTGVGDGAPADRRPAARGGSRGRTTAVADAVPVAVDSARLPGTVSSSRLQVAGLPGPTRYPPGPAAATTARRWGAGLREPESGSIAPCP